MNRPCTMFFRESFSADLCRMLIAHDRVLWLGRIPWESYRMDKFRCAKPSLWRVDRYRWVRACAYVPSRTDADAIM